MKHPIPSRCVARPAVRAGLFIRIVLFSLPLIALAVGLLWPAPSRAEVSFANAQGKASASLNFRIVIPPVMRVLENSHSAQLQPSADGSSLTGEQRLVVVSNMKHGFCVALRPTSPEITAGWKLQQSADSSHAVLSPLADGYRLCTSGPGRYTLLLQHAFPASALVSGAAAGSDWPVQTELMAL